MNKTDFLERIFQKHIEVKKFPATSSICKLMTQLLLVLFPEQSKKTFKNKEEINEALEAFGSDLLVILEAIPESWINNPKSTVKLFLDALPGIYIELLDDIDAALKGDPAAVNEYEIIRAYPGFYAICLYRFAHNLYTSKVPLIPRIITEFAHSKTGIDIHPGARIAPSFYIDHGTGVVIGGTSIIGKNVKIYQGVTLGALSVSKDLAEVKRHPTIEDNVVIYSGTTILGGETTIGANSIIGGNVWLTKSVPANSKVYHQSETIVKLSENI